MPIFVGAGTSSFAKGTGGVGFSQITTSTRDALSGIVEGQVIFNTTTDKLQIYVGSQWVDVSKTPFDVNGGNSVSTSSRTGFKVHTFTSPGTLSVVQGQNEAGQVEILVVDHSAVFSFRG